MEIKFNSGLGYQIQAIKAVTDLFDGQQPIEKSNFEISASARSDMLFNELCYPNQITLSDNDLFTNVRKIQNANNIEESSVLAGRNFSIEMETGTGKTYVYLRSIFELSKNYGFKKFIIVVPSVAIREGVLKAIEMTKGHFSNLYDNEPFNHFVYDSKELDLVCQFSTSNQIQIMVINIQSFQRDIADEDTLKMTEEEMTKEMTEKELKKLNVINRENDKMSGYKPIEFIQATRPIVIIDEPQSVDNTEKSKKAIANLNPIITLRYSATHRNPYNLLYKLDPVQAYDMHLVKRIEVASIRTDYSFNDAYVKLLKTNNKNGIKAQVEIHKEKNGNVKPVKLWVKQDDDLYRKSGKRQHYQNGYIVQNIDCTPGAEYNIEFSNGLKLSSKKSGRSDDIMKAQVKETIRQHLDKEHVLLEKKIKVKVLSLFFIDKVANYRTYNDDGSTGIGTIGESFEDAYREITTEGVYKKFSVPDISKIHNGYFSKDNRGRLKDTSGKTAGDEDAYNLIMREKERLLDPKEPLRFIFSHSALREGWDNPNVFQICTLNKSKSVDKKRQEIGRGLRLPVNEKGKRVRDEEVNRLTIIANESYEDFARSLQTEFEKDFGIKFGCIEKITFAKISRIKDGDSSESIGQEESNRVWEELNVKGYIDDEGKILDTFDPENPYFELKIAEKYNDIKADIIKEMQRFIFKNRPANARERYQLVLNEKVYKNKEYFQALWNKIKHRTRYRVEFDTKELIDHAVKNIEGMDIKVARITVTQMGLDLTDAGVSADRKINVEKVCEIDSVKVLPDLLAYLQKETKLTRDTLAKILSDSDRLDDFRINPQQFMTRTAREISRALHNLMLEGIQYEKIDGYYWKMCRIKKEAERNIIHYSNDLYKVKNPKKYLFDWVKYDSGVENKFAKDLDHREKVKSFVKLPNWFKIDTPIGTYNPDWAFIVLSDKRNEKLYFVCETKSTTNLDKLRPEEQQRIHCGKKHFKAIDVEYDVAKILEDFLGKWDE